MTTLEKIVKLLVEDGIHEVRELKTAGGYEFIHKKFQEGTQTSEKFHMAWINDLLQEHYQKHYDDSKLTSDHAHWWLRKLETFWGSMAEACDSMGKMDKVVQAMKSATKDL